MSDKDRKHELGMKIAELLNANNHTSMKDDAEVLLTLLHHCLSEIGVEKVIGGNADTVAVVNIVDRKTYEQVEALKEDILKRESKSEDVPDAPTNSDVIH